MEPLEQPEYARCSYCGNEDYLCCKDSSGNHMCSNCYTDESANEEQKSITEINIHRSINDETTTPETTSNMMTASGQRLSFNGTKTRARAEVRK